MLPLRNLDNWRDELLQEAWDLQQGRPEAVNKIDEQTFDVRSCSTFRCCVRRFPALCVQWIRTIVVLICHNHYMTVTQRVCIFVMFASLQPQNLFERRDFCVVHNLQSAIVLVACCPDHGFRVSIKALHTCF